METLLKDPGLAARILKRLESRSDRELPREGILAGGAVANTILALLDGNDYPVRDLDVFVRWRHDDGKNEMPVRDVAAGVEASGAGLSLVIKESYTVHRSWQRGALNLIGITGKRPDGMARVDAQTVLSGFDLNCCGAAIDLAGGTLHLSEDFLRFLRTRELRAVFPVTPCHTLIRMAVKRRDLGCYLKLAEEASFLASFVEAARDRPHPGSSELLYAPNFGAKHRRLYEEHRSELEPVSSLQETGEQDLWTLALSGGRAAELLEAVGELRYPEFLSCACVFRTAWDRIFRPGVREAEKRRFLVACADPVGREMALAFPGYADPPFDDSHLKRVARFLDRHPNLANRLGETAADQYRSVRALGRAKRRHGLLVLGLVESAEEGLALPVPLTDRSLEDLAASYRALVPQKREGVRVPWPLRPWVRELRTPEELAEEGRLMRHCVGGYAPHLATGRSLFFHVSLFGKCSTLQVERAMARRGGLCYPDPARLPRLQQHRGVSNAEPGSGERRIAGALVWYLSWRLTPKAAWERTMAPWRSRLRARLGRLARRARGRISGRMPEPWR